MMIEAQYGQRDIAGLIGWHLGNALALPFARMVDQMRKANTSAKILREDADKNQFSLPAPRPRGPRRALINYFCPILLAVGARENR